MFRCGVDFSSAGYDICYFDRLGNQRVSFEAITLHHFLYELDFDRVVVCREQFPKELGTQFQINNSIDLQFLI